jgi:hypothetical protein
VWPEGQVIGPEMPSEQQGESMKAGQEPSPEPGTDMVPAAPRKPRKFSKLVLLTASKDSAKVAGAKRKGVHCIMSLGVPGPATLAKALLKTHPEAQRAIEAAPQEPEQKRSKLDPGEAPGVEAAPPRDRAAPHRWLLFQGLLQVPVPSWPLLLYFSEHTWEAGGTGVMGAGWASLVGPRILTWPLPFLPVGLVLLSVCSLLCVPHMVTPLQECLRSGAPATMHSELGAAGCPPGLGFMMYPPHVIETTCGQCRKFLHSVT